MYTQFRKQVEGGSKVRQPFEMPAQLNPLPEGLEEGDIPTMEALGVKGNYYECYDCCKCLSLQFCLVVINY